MSDRRDEFGDTAIAVIAFAQPEELAAHRAHLGLPFPFLADPDRITYRRFGLERGTVREVWSPGTLKLYLQLMARGRRLQRPRHDTRQLGGDIIIDAAGRLAAAFRPRSPDERPTVDELIDALA